VNLKELSLLYLLWRRFAKEVGRLSSGLSVANLEQLVDFRAVFLVSSVAIAT